MSAYTFHCQVEQLEAERKKEPEPAAVVGAPPLQRTRASTAREEQQMALESGAGSVQEFQEQQAATRQQQLQSELAVRCQRPAFVRAALVRYLQGKQWSAIQHVICGHNDGGSRVAPAMVENKVVLALGDRDKRISLTDLPEYGAVPPGAIAIPRCKTAFVTSAGPLRTHATVRNHDVDGQV